MFGKARLSLTAWYLLIIMLISISFSVAMYKILTSEFDRVARIQKTRQQHAVPPQNFHFDQDPGQNHFYMYVIDPELVEETKTRILVILLLINAGILCISAVAGYFLAGRTLRPIKDMMDEQNRFITDASHELRTPITSLKAEIEVALREKGITKSSKSILESNLEDVNNLQMLSDKLIHLTQYEQSATDTFEILSLPEVINTSLKKVSGLAKRKHIEFKTVFKDVNISGDRVSLTELFVIFFDNAIKYSPEKSTVHVSLVLSSKSQVKVTIKDQGIGISEEDLPHIFERFYKADKSRSKTTSDGFGLGLSIAKHIINLHNGSIQVKSTLGKGTAFVISFPIGEYA